MLIEKRLSKIAEITNSRQFGKDLSFKNISIDSRSIKQGDLFVAIKEKNLMVMILLVKLLRREQ